MAIESRNTGEGLIGSKLQDLQAPAAIIDAGIARRNCRLMLETTSKLGVAFRAHVKTHKTTQLAQLQVGVDSKDIRLIVSTVAELEHFLPWLLRGKEDGKEVNVLYGLPVSMSSIPRLAKIATMLGSNSVSVIIDHPSQVKALDHPATSALWPDALVPVFVKIDVGYHRAGVMSNTGQMTALAEALANATHLRLDGFYAHMGQSYEVSCPEEAVDALVMELETLQEGAKTFLTSIANEERPFRVTDRLMLTLGASPTVTAAQNLLGDGAESTDFRARLSDISRDFAIELHAGVYPLLDMQQLATRARPIQVLTDQPQTLLSFADLGLRILVEVVSIYDDRNGEMEALIAAGSIVLGREPCKVYIGQGVVSPWPSDNLQFYEPDEERSGWIVHRTSQEHGILRWQGSRQHFWPLTYGQKLLIWPNHACMAGPSFDQYLIVDSERGEPDTVVDVWQRCRGW